MIVRRRVVRHRSRMKLYRGATHHRDLAQHGGKGHARSGRNRRGVTERRQEGDVCSNSHAKTPFGNISPRSA
jgi:hypothetical protein